MRTRASVLVGRDDELHVLDQALERARRGRGRAVFLVGEAGVGKSRLAVEAENRAFTAGMRLLRGRGSTIGAMVPFRPLTEALLSLLRTGEVPEASELGPYRPVLGRLVPDWAQDSAPTAHADGDFRIILAEAVIRLTGLIGREHGTLLILDDLQDADAETLAVVEYLVDNLDRQPTVLLGTVRAESSPALDLARSAAQRQTCTVLELARLGRAQVRLLAGSCLDGPADQVPDAVLDRLWEDSAGNPFVVEELLNGMVGSGLLVRSGQGWRVAGEIRGEVPTTLARSVARRADQLGTQGRRLLSAAAVIGHRFPLAVVRTAAGLDERSALSHLRAGLEAQLVMFDEQAPDWYAFQHPLTAEALLAQLSGVERAELAGRAADATEALHPGLPGEWCQLVATLRLDAGNSVAAGRLFAEAGRRAAAQGAANSAVTLLDRASDLLGGDPDARAEVLEALLLALAEAGLVDRAMTLANTLDETGGGGLDARRRAALHGHIAWTANVAGRVDVGMAQVEAARALLGPDPDDADVAPIDAVAAYLALDLPDGDRLDVAEGLARRAARMAEAANLPVPACQAWQLLGVVSRRRDLDESTACFARAYRIATEHQLPVWQIHALIRLGGNDALVDGDTGRLAKALDEAVAAGAVTATYDAEANLAFQAVLRGEFAAATEMIDQCLTAVQRLNLIDRSQYLLLARAVVAGHQGRRREMDRALADFRRWGGEDSLHHTLGYGLARAFCALLEEDVERARVELAEAAALERSRPTIFYLAGRYGLSLLLGVLSGTAGPAAHAEISALPASRLRWNRQFVLFAGAVLAARDGRTGEAEAMVGQAQTAGEPYPTARHLGLRLVGEAALAGAWGTPVAWLTDAEEYFQAAAVPAVAGACRRLLRAAGAPVPQRRGGSDRIPAALRSLGVTVREYEVLELLVDRLGNRAIASRLQISPRTAEKHVASLILKTGQPGRDALCEAAPTLLVR